MSLKFEISAGAPSAINEGSKAFIRKETMTNLMGYYSTSLDWSFEISEGSTSCSI
jgi:hypothetical protein